jgi:protein gp37
MADVFEDHKDLVEPRKRLWEVIAKTPNLDWMLLTKRPENMVAMGPEAWAKRWPDNVWAGTTAATQEWADKRCPILAQVPAKIRWLSVEPMLGPMNLAKYFDEGYDGYEGWVHTGSLIQWVIVGGESGRHARLMEASWALDLLKQCRRYDVSFFFKQQGDVLARVMGARRGKGDDPTEWPEEFKIQEFPRVA